jgi:hypothetical protein
MARPKKQIDTVSEVTEPVAVAAAPEPMVHFDEEAEYTIYDAARKCMVYDADGKIIKCGRAEAETWKSKAAHGVVCLFSEVTDRINRGFPIA